MEAPLTTELVSLFLLIARLLTFDALRLNGRERQFALLLASESFGRGADCGPIGISTPVQRVAQTGEWCRRLHKWRPAEIWLLFETWRRHGWIMVDAAEGVFRLCPDNLPGWADAVHLLGNTKGQKVLPLESEEDLDKAIAKISQLGAIAKFSQLEPGGGRGGSVDRSNESSKIPNSIRLDRSIEDENAKIPQLGDSARGYIEEKLCLPKLQKLRIEMTGGNNAMSRKFVEMLHTHPELLAEWIGEAAQPGITDPCRFINSRMSHIG
jgi:hypothetical protein